MTINIYINEHSNTTVNLLYLQIGEFIYGNLNSTMDYRSGDKIIVYNDCDKLSENENYNFVICYINLFCRKRKFSFQNNHQ